MWCEFSVCRIPFTSIFKSKTKAIENKEFHLLVQKWYEKYTYHNMKLMSITLNNSKKRADLFKKNCL